MNKKKIAVFPMDEATIPYIKYSLIDQYDVVAAYTSDKGSCLEKEVILENGRLVIKNINQCKYEEFDIMWLVNSEEVFAFEDDILPVIEQAAYNKKDICMSISLNKEMMLNCQEICERNNVAFTRITENEQINLELTEKLLKVSTPIIFVLGIYEHTSKLDTLLYLHKAAKVAGYRPYSILTRTNDFALEDCHGFPKFMLNDGINDKLKVLLFNHFVRKLEIEKKPDLILVGIPGEIISINKELFGNFSIMPYLVSNAISCDYAVLKLFNDFYTKEFAEKMRNYCSQKYSIEIDSFVVSETLLDVANADKRPTLQYYYSNEKHKDLDDMYYFGYVDGYGRNLQQHMLDTLQGYGNYNSI
jgi:peptide maturation system protein (TIGR04066 family)